MWLNYTMEDGTCTGSSFIHEQQLLPYVFGATGAMYGSYFVLFFLFYLERYYSKTK